MIGRSPVSIDPTENASRVGVNANPSATSTPVGTSTAAMLLRRSRTSASWSRSENALSARSDSPYQCRGPNRSPARAVAPATAVRTRGEQEHRRAERPGRHRHEVLRARVEVVGGDDVHRRAVRDRRRVGGQLGERLDDEAAGERDRGQHGDRRDQQRRDRRAARPRPRPRTARTRSARCRRT